jgi:hypothetical protein
MGWRRWLFGRRGESAEREEVQERRTELDRLRLLDPFDRGSSDSDEDMAVKPDPDILDAEDTVPMKRDPDMTDSDSESGIEEPVVKADFIYSYLRPLETDLL